MSKSFFPHLRVCHRTPRRSVQKLYIPVQAFSTTPPSNTTGNGKPSKKRRRRDTMIDGGPIKTDLVSSLPGKKPWMSVLADKQRSTTQVVEPYLLLLE